MFQIFRDDWKRIYLQTLLFIADLKEEKKILSLFQKKPLSSVEVVMVMYMLWKKETAAKLSSFSGFTTYRGCV